MSDLRTNMLEKYSKIRNSFLDEEWTDHCAVLVDSTSILKRARGARSIGAYLHPFLSVDVEDCTAEETVE